MNDRWTERVRRADPEHRRRLHEARIAFEALRIVTRDPGKTEHVFEVLENFPVWDALQWTGRRLPVLRDPRFRALWQRRAMPDFTTPAALRMRDLPDGTLGHEYGEFVAARGLDNIFLEYWTIDEPSKYLAWRTAHLHDLLHFLLGYTPFDDIGEMEIEAFLYAQTGALNHVLFVLGYMMHLVRTDRRTLVRAVPRLRDAYRYGARTSPVLLVEWEALLERPLAQVRRMLRIDERPVVPRPPPPNRTDLVPRLAHTVHNVRDLDAAVAFYRDVFGYQVVTVDRALGVTFLSAGDDHHTIALQEVVRRPRDGLRRLASLVRGVREGRALPSWPVVRASLRPGHNHTGYRVPDEAALRAFVARLRAAGGRVAWAVNHGDLIKAAYFVDPAGNLCEVFVDGEGAIALRERMARGEPLASLAPEDLPTYPLDLS